MGESRLPDVLSVVCQSSRRFPRDAVIAEIDIPNSEPPNNLHTHGAQGAFEDPFLSIDWSAVRQRDLLPTNEPVLSSPSRNITIEPTSQITKLHLYYAAPPESNNYVEDPSIHLFVHSK